jgi:hypothetical protein
VLVRGRFKTEVRCRSLVVCLLLPIACHPLTRAQNGTGSGKWEVGYENYLTLSRAKARSGIFEPNFELGLKYERNSWVGIFKPQNVNVVLMLRIAGSLVDYC